MLNGLRRAVAVLLALSADSPFSQGGPQRVRLAPDGDLPGVPRTGTARWFAGYADNVYALDALIASGALADLSFPWWDVLLAAGAGDGSRFG